ncbi:keratinocyte-associated protein 2-like [Lytechinus pictus]|uniref:keratinocyte-associated protein 2-like n=1 Tax=Lytechinus pictus TaxID=7653 RepID=UPI0030B9E35B
MAVSSGVSALLSAILAVALFAGMQTYRTQLADSEWLTIFGGFLGADLFILILTCISNIETMLFGKGFQAKLIPEVAVALVAAMFASGLVHRVCVTTCVLFSMVGLYYVNKISQATYAPPPSVAASIKKKK